MKYLKKFFSWCHEIDKNFPVLILLMGVAFFILVVVNETISIYQRLFP